MSQYAAIKETLTQGWNTYDTSSMLSHILMPYGIAIKLSFKSYANKAYLRNALTGRLETNAEQLRPGLRGWDSSYTHSVLKWYGLETQIETAVDGEDLVVMITTTANEKKPATLITECGVLWNKPGYAVLDDDKVQFVTPEKKITLYSTTAKLSDEPYTECMGAYLAITLDGKVGLSTGKNRTIEEIEDIIRRYKDKMLCDYDTFGECKEIYAAIKTCMSWDTVYEPLKSRVVSPVSRVWNCQRGGYTLFCWDSFFAAYMASVDNEELAYANVIEIINEMTPQGFIPNVSFATGRKSLDRSQPPVGSLISLMLYKRFKKKWFLEQIFESLLRWNNWWEENRKNGLLLSWGSNDFDPVVGDPLEYKQPHTAAAAALESGLDNSPMYDDVPFNMQTSMMELNDVGLNSLYISDCKSLAQIADILGRKSQSEQLFEKAQRYTENLNKLCWDEKSGIYLNYCTDTGARSGRISPTNFYPLLADAATDARVERMLKDHLYNEKEFWGRWVIPSISRSDAAYGDQHYWRGRVWGPMNFLVYLGLCNYKHLDIAVKIRKELADKSAELLMKEWRSCGHIHENYNADTGDGCDSADSDRFYNWGGLLGLIKLIELGYFPELDEDLVLQ